MKKGSIVAVVVVLVILVAGGYMLFHKSPKSNTTSTSSQSQTSSNTAAINNAILVTKMSTSVGQYLAEPDGQPLYTYGGDSSGVSNCTGSCLANWPPYQAKGSTTNLPTGVSTIKRSDNSETQYTYNGMPLYTFTGDSNGSVTGNNVANFSVAKPAASTTTGTSGTSGTSSTTTTSGNNSSTNW